MTLRVCHKYSMDGKTPFHKYFGRILFPFHPPQGQNTHVRHATSSGSSTFGQERLGGYVFVFGYCFLIFFILYSFY